MIYKLSEINNKDFVKRYALQVNKLIGDGTLSGKEKDLTCWSMYYSKMKESDFDYLNKYGDFYIPVKVRFTSIIRDNIDFLVSKYLNNPFNFSAKTVDKKSLQKKFRSKVEQLVKNQLDIVDQQFFDLQSQMIKMEQEREMLHQQLNQQPQNQEQAMRLQEIQQQMPLIELKLQQFTKSLQREIRKNAEAMDIREALSKLKPKDIREDFVQRKLVDFYENSFLANVHKKTITEMYVTGKPYIFVDIVDNKLVYKYIPSYAVRQPENSSVDEVENGDWVGYEENLSYDKVISLWGEDIGFEGLKALEHYNTNKNKMIDQQYEDKDAGAANYVQGYKPVISQNNIRVFHLYFQVQAEIPVLKSIGKNGSVHTHLATDDQKIKEGQEIIKRYKSYAFEAHIILGSIVVGMKMRKHQALKVDNLGWNQLPIIGNGYDNVTRSPYSLIWTTRDLQAMYQIIEYYEELLLVISGVKGFVMDASQKPDNMSDNEWMYHRKLGTVWIETWKKDRRGQQSSFNQFQTYDDSIPASIQYLGMMKDRIHARIDRLTGVSRQARGEMQERDAVGTAKLSIQATNIIADVLYWEHDQIVRRALTRAMNLYCKFIGHEGDAFSIFDKQIGEFDTINIPKGLLDGADYDIIMMNNNKDAREVQELKNLVTAEYQRGKIDFLGMVNLFQSTSVVEMRVLAERMVEKADEMQQMAVSNQTEAQKELLVFQNELAMKLKEGDIQLKNMENQLKKLDLDIKEKEIIFDKDFNEKKLASDNYFKAMEIITKKDTDDQKLNNEANSVAIDQTLKAVELQIQQKLGSEKNLIDDRKLDTKTNK